MQIKSQIIPHVNSCEKTCFQFLENVHFLAPFTRMKSTVFLYII